MLIQMRRTLLNICLCRIIPIWSRLDNGDDEKIDEPIQLVLVHRLNASQILDAKEQHGGMLGRGHVAGTCLVNLDLCLGRFSLFRVDLFGEDFGR